MLTRATELIPYLIDNDEIINKAYHLLLDTGKTPTMVDIARAWSMYSQENYGANWMPMRNKDAKEIVEKIKEYFWFL